MFRKTIYTSPNMLPASRLCLGIGLASVIATAGAAPPSVESSEYQKSDHLAGINVAPAWTAKLLGSGVSVAILDTGVRASHIDLRGRIGSGGYNFLSPDANPDDDHVGNTKGHGTASASIISGIWNGIGGAGIAPSAKIIPIKIADSEFNSTPDLIARGVHYANTKTAARIILIQPTRHKLSSSEFDNLRGASSKGKLLIAPAGNDGNDGPQDPARQFSTLGDSALVVGSHDNGLRSNFSNGAKGVAQNYIMAPGRDVLTAGNVSDSFFRFNTGTSMAAPQVAAAAALLMAHSPQLSGAQIAKILKESATDLGAPGVDDKYGWGALNIERALAPIGAITIPVEEDPDPEEDPPASDEESVTDKPSSGSSGSGGGAGLALGALVVGGVGYALIRNSTAADSTLVVDDYGRTYELDLETRVTVRNPGPSAQSVLKELDSQAVEETLIQRNDLTLTATYLSTGSMDFHHPGYTKEYSQDRPVRMQITGTDNVSSSFAFGINQSVRLVGQGGQEWEEASALASSFRSDSFDMPFLGFSDMGYHAAYEVTWKEGWRTGLTFAAIDDQKKYGLKSESSSLKMGFNDSRYSLNMQLGLLEEDGSVLGGSSGGALSVSGAETLFGALRARFMISSNWSVVSQYTHGITWTKNSANSLVKDFSEIHSNSWGLGLIGRNLLSRGDAFGFAVAQPLRTIGGDADVSVPYYNPSVGGVAFREDRVNLVPEGTETAFEFFYRRPITNRVQWLSYLAHRSQPLHQKNGSQTSVVGAFSWKFGTSSR